MTTPIRYAIRPKHPEAHLFEVHCLVEQPDPGGQRFALPAWIPGSYLIRDFARHVVSVSARAGGRPVRLTKLDKHTWQAAPLRGAAALTVTCEVYAWDLSVRAAHLDRSHGFFNGTSVFLQVVGQEDRPCLVDIQPPEGDAYRDWRVATALAPAPRGTPGGAKRHGFGLYRAADYDELIDHPVEMGTFALFRFEAAGVEHEVAITGRQHCDLDRLARDMKRICAWHIRLFGRPGPVKRYVFLVMAVGEGHGGLEHRASTALLCGRNDLPPAGMDKMTEAYRGFLGLVSHEYFHTWNVKRIKPADFVPYDLGRENYTRLLWAFEGFTSYYDDLALVRSGAIDRDSYLELLGKTISQVHRSPGRFRQSLAESSFDAWTKFYRQDENSPNAIVSYYAKGALVALALDLTLRSATGGRVALDDVMRRLWNEFGRRGIPVGDDDVRLVAEAASGLDLKRFFRRAVNGTADLPLAPLLEQVGVRLSWETTGPVASLGLRTTGDGNDLRITTVLDGGAGQRAGLSAGDVLVAVDGIRVTATNLDKVLGRYREGDRVVLHAFRRDELFEAAAVLDPPPRDVGKLELVEKPGAGAVRVRDGWLGRPGRQAS